MSKLDRRKHHRRLALSIGLGLVLPFVIVAILLNLPTPTGRGLYTGYPAQLRVDFATLQDQVGAFQAYQRQQDASVVSGLTLQQRLSSIELLAATGRYLQAQKEIKDLRHSMTDWRKQIAVGKVVPTPTPAPESGAVAYSNYGLTIPILIYHYTPADFDAQLSYLEARNYTVVGFDAVLAALHGHGGLPAKPAVITFDDGFENQMVAFDILKRHNMKATFYIINGGPASNWCIGAGRRYGDPSQPTAGCGDSYLTWDQVRSLDQSGLITIGGHTYDHPSLPTLSVDDQRHEIIDSKHDIEAELGHPIYDFAYPYGSYDQTTINLVAQAGYRSAVTTLVDVFQPTGSDYTLRRVRTTYVLP